MRPGDVVNIYEDPITRKKAEGIATLERKIGDYDVYEGMVLERWEVRFFTKGGGVEEETFERIVSYEEGENA